MRLKRRFGRGIVRRRLTESALNYFGKLVFLRAFKKRGKGVSSAQVYLCKLYGLTEKDIICHSEGHAIGVASGHADVMHWFPKHGKSMDTFREDVAIGLKGEEDMAEQQTRQIAREEAKAQTTVFRNLEDVPAWGKPTVEKLLESQAITGDGKGIDLPYETLRLLVINDRMGLYGK